jgi:hypothetical protein
LDAERLGCPVNRWGVREGINTIAERDSLLSTQLYVVGSAYLPAAGPPTMKTCCQTYRQTFVGLAGPRLWMHRTGTHDITTLWALPIVVVTTPLQEARRKAGGVIKGRLVMPMNAFSKPSRKK